MLAKGIKLKIQRFERLVSRLLASRNAYIASAILFKVSLDFGYWVFISPVYNYMGFIWSPDIIKYIEAWFLYSLLVLLAPKRLKKISDVFLLIILFNILAPSLAFYSLADQSRYFLYIILVGYFLVLVFRRGKPLRLTTLREGKNIAKYTVILFVFGISAWFFVSGALKFFNLNLTKVYEFRDLAGEVIRKGPMAYLNTWAYFVFGPALLSYTLWHRTFIFAGLVVLIHSFWFGVSSHKIVLFSPLLVIVVWFWFRKGRSLSMIPFGLFAFVTVCIFSFLVFDVALPASLFVRRVFYIPALLTFDYYDFFTNNQWVLWSNSKVSLGLVEYPYYLIPAELIGVWRGTESNANNGFLATGYMHAGIFGIIIYGILVGFLFRIIDSIAHKNIPIWFALGIIIIPIYSLIISSDLPTALLSKGVGVGMLVLFLARSADTLNLPQKTKYDLKN